MRIAPIWAASTMAAALGSATLGAQERVVVSDAPSCECELEIQRVTTIQDPDGRAGLSRPLVVDRTATGDYLVVPASRQGAVLRFDGRGRYMGMVGRPGQGPEKFGAVLRIGPGWGDSTLVLDAGNRRLAVLDRGLNVTRTVRLPVVGGWFGPVDGGGLLLLGGIRRGRSGSADRLFLLDPSMDVEMSFLPNSGGPNTDVASLRRRMSVPRNGWVAVSHWNRYVVEVWSVNGERVRTIIREPEWFPNAQEEEADGPRIKQETPQIDSEGHLWTLSHVADEDWRESTGQVRTVYGRAVEGVPPGAQNGYYDSVVEVIDLDSGTLVASSQVDPHLTYLSEGGYAFSYREDREGYPSIDVWQLRVVAREREREQEAALATLQLRVRGLTGGKENVPRALVDSR